MRTRSLLLAMALLVAVTPVAADDSGIHIAEIYPDPATGDREFIELFNEGTVGIDLDGWVISDEAGNTYTFSNRTLAAGGRIVVWGGGSDDHRGPAWSRAAVWNNGGDAATLKDASGTVIDVLAYGSSAWPDGRNDSVPAAPPTGESLAWVQSSWVAGAPTPGTAPGSQSGTVSATVADVPPSVAFLAPPIEVEPGQTVDLAFNVSEPNGDGLTWQLLSDGAVVATGTSTGDLNHILTAPTDRDVWRLRLDATDEGGNASSAYHNATVAAQGLVVQLPAGGLTFPTLHPGDEQVLTTTSFTVRNEGAEAVTPRIDISDLVGGSSIPVAGNLVVVIEVGNATQTVDYAGALQSLPNIAPGEAWEVWLRIAQVPSPLPAGSYGTSFTVIG